MHVIDFNSPSPSATYFARRHRIATLAMVGGLIVFGGCNQSRIFKRTPAGNGMLGHVENGNGVRVTQQSSPGETESAVPPVEQRLAKNGTPSPSRAIQSDLVPAQRTTPTSQASTRSTTQEATRPTSVANTSVSETGTSARQSSAASTPDPNSSDSASASPQIDDESIEGVDLDELMLALKDAPEDVRRLAAAQMIAMSRRNATLTQQPRGIDEAISQSLDSLPTLPNEVIDTGVSPKRLASRETMMSLSDRDQSVAKVSHQISSPSDSAHSSGHTKPISSNVPVQTAAYRDEQSVAPDHQTAPKPTGQATASPSQSGIEDLSNAEIFDVLLTRLQQAGEGESDADRTRREVMSRHLMVLAGDPDSAAEKLEGLDQAEQEYLRHQLLGLWTIIDPAGHPVASRRLSSALPQIRQAAQFLAAASDSLEIRSLEFCTEIEAYGQIKPFDQRQFRPGQEVILYCEIENFVTQAMDQGFETVLQGSYDVVDADNVKVASQTLPVDRQISRNRLRDYFIAYQMHLPKTLGEGDYRLRLTMEDVHGRKYGQSEVGFQVTSSTSR